MRLRVLGQGRILFGDDLRERCESTCTVRVRAGTGRLRLQAAAEEEDGYYFLEYRDWCGEWFRSRGPDCTLSRLWEDTTVTAAFRRRPIVFLTVRGGGVVRSVRGPFGEPAQSDLACRSANSPCRVRTIEPGKWRRLRAVAEPGWRFDHWEGECYRVPSAFNRNELCDVEGNDPQRTARAVFVRGS